MTHPLRLFEEVMVLSGLSCLGLGTLMLLLTRWRVWFRRCLDAESALWRRLGLPERWTSSMRRFEESRTLRTLVGALLGLHLVLWIFAAAAHAYFAPRLKNAPTAGAQGPPPVLRQTR
jgi:hypothetical protein